MLMPPSTAMTCPVIYPASSLARNATVLVTSSAAPMRPMGMAARVVVLEASGMAAVMSVYMKPGATALTVTPRLANSLARDLVMPMTPALLAA